MWKFKYQDEYLLQVQDLERHRDVKAMRLLPQHVPGVSTYDHATLVAYSSFRICRALRLDARAAARGGLLHDLFLYNWKDRSLHTGPDHAFHHPWYALENARARFPLSVKEEDIIATHMWPITPTKFYHCWESLVVSCMDKLCATAELLRLVPLLPLVAAKSAPLPCSSSPHETRFAGLARGPRWPAPKAG